MSSKKIILLTAFIDVLGISIIIPILPFYVESFGASAFMVTTLFSVYALCSFLSAPLLGSLSDKIGRRPVLLISILSTSIGWLVFASAKSIYFLFIGRIIDGLAAGNLPTAQSYLTDLAKDEKDRSANLGLIGAIFGIAFIIGPAIGGYLGSISHTLPFWFVGFLALFNFITAFFKLPESHKNPTKDKKISPNPFKPFFGIFENYPLFVDYLVWFIFGVAISMQQSVFALYLNKVFSLKEASTGTFLTISGIILAINQAFLLKKFWLKYFKEKALSLIMFATFSLAFVLLSIPNLIIFTIAMILATICHSVLRVILTSLASRKSPSKTGEILGVLSSIMSLSMVIGPLIAGWFFLIKPYIPFLFSSILAIISFVLIYRVEKNLKTLKIIEDPVL